MSLTPERLAEIRARRYGVGEDWAVHDDTTSIDGYAEVLARYTPEPNLGAYSYDRRIARMECGDAPDHLSDEEAARETLALAHWIAGAPADVDALLAEVDRLRARVAELEQTALSPQGPICTEAEARAAGLDIAPSPAELEVMASSVIDAAGGDQVAADLARAVLLLLAARAQTQQQTEAVAPTPARADASLIAAQLGGDRSAVAVAHRLVAEGFTADDLPAATDAELLAIPGLGPAAVARIREHFGSEETEL